MGNTDSDKFSKGYGEKAYEHAKPSFTREAVEKWTLETETVNKKRREEYEARLEKFTKKHGLEDIAALKQKDAQLDTTLKFESGDTLYPILKEKLKMNERTAFFVMVQMLKQGINVDLWEAGDEIKLSTDGSLEIKKSGKEIKIANIFEVPKNTGTDVKEDKKSLKKEKKPKGDKVEKSCPSENVETGNECKPEQEPHRTDKYTTPPTPPLAPTRTTTSAESLPEPVSPSPPAAPPAATPEVSETPEQKLDKAINTITKALKLYNLFQIRVNKSDLNEYSVIPKITEKYPAGMSTKPDSEVTGARFSILKSDPQHYKFGDKTYALDNVKDLQLILYQKLIEVLKERAAQALEIIKGNFEAIGDRTKFTIELSLIDESLTFGIYIFYKKKDKTQGACIAIFKMVALPIEKDDLFDNEFRPLVQFHLFDTITNKFGTKPEWRNRDPKKLYENVNLEIFGPKGVIAKMEAKDTTIAPSIFSPAAPPASTTTRANAVDRAMEKREAAPTSPDQIEKSRSNALKKFREIAKDRTKKGEGFLSSYDYYVYKGKKLLVTAFGRNNEIHIFTAKPDPMSTERIKKAPAIVVVLTDSTTIADIDAKIKENKTINTPLGRISPQAINEL